MINASGVKLQRDVNGDSESEPRVVEKTTEDNFDLRQKRKSLWDHLESLDRRDFERRSFSSSRSIL